MKVSKLVIAIFSSALAFSAFSLGEKQDAPAAKKELIFHKGSSSRHGKTDINGPQGGSIHHQSGHKHKHKSGGLGN